MISDSIVNSSIPSASKDFSKKKRANRSAKLKQCKLDARRQQWLSQVDSKGPKAEGSGNENLNREVKYPTVEAKKGNRKGKGKEPCCKGVEVRNVSVEKIHNHDSDSEGSSVATSPMGCVIDSGNHYVGSSSSSTSSSSASSASFGSGGSYSGSMTEEEEGGVVEFGGDDECLDDWETVADALVGAQTNDNPQTRDENVSAQVEKGTTDSVTNLGGGGKNSKAWGLDDASRPQSLPNLSNQRSFPPNSERRSGRGLNPWVCKMTSPVPTSCPICCEDLDFTDSSFLPCPCGFHLCLFCHKRILEEDARCPGCRKPYSSSEAVEEGSLTIRLARSCSMFSRV